MYDEDDDHARPEVPYALREDILELASILHSTDYGEHADTQERVAEAIYLLAGTMGKYKIGHAVVATHERLAKENDVLWHRVAEMQERIKKLLTRTEEPT